MKLLLLSVLVASAVAHYIEHSEDDLNQWEMFKVEHQKVYGTEEEEQHRVDIFLNNLKFVRQHNEKYRKGEVTFEVEINRFSDLEGKEFAAMFNGYRFPKNFVRSGKAFNVSEDFEVPASVDWRKKGAVTEVKDQGQCGSCWAFSATGSVEGAHFLSAGKLVSLSEQNLVDCSEKEGNGGCQGGLPDNAFQYIIDKKGIDTEESYPYEGKDDKCRYKKKNIGATISAFVDVESGNEKKLQAAVAHNPVSVGIDASQPSFQMYKKGVYKDPNCQSDMMDLDHGVLAVGYGHAKKGGDYWLVKNSWGKDWGMQGYILMARNHDNMCGIATAASYPTV